MHSSGLAHRPRGTEGVHPSPRHRQQAKTHAPTDVAALRALQQHSPLASLVLRWRSIQYVLSKCACRNSSSLFAQLRKHVRRNAGLFNLSDGMQNGFNLSDGEQDLFDVTQGNSPALLAKQSFIR